MQKTSLLPKIVEIVWGGNCGASFRELDSFDNLKVLNQNIPIRLVGADWVGDSELQGARDWVLGGIFVVDITWKGFERAIYYDRVTNYKRKLFVVFMSVHISESFISLNYANKAF